MSLRSKYDEAGLRVVPLRAEGATTKRRAQRAQLDLERIRSALDSDVELRSEVYAMLSAAFTAMATGVQNHASEFMPGAPQTQFHS